MLRPSVILVGAGGYLGRIVVAQFLAQRAQFARIAILADPSKISKFNDMQKEGIEIVSGSFYSPDSFKGFDTVLSFLGTNALAFQPGIIDAAIAAGVTSFYPSEYGADLSQAPFATNRFFRDKTITRDYLEARTKGLPKFHYTYIVTGVFAEFLPSSFFGIDPQKHEFTFYGDPEGKVALTSTADIAKYTVASVLLSQDSQSRTFKIPTSAYTWTSLINMISRIQNVPYESHSRSLSEVNALQEEAAKRGDEDAEMLYAMRGALGIPIEPVPRPWDHDKFSFEPVDLETSLRNVLGA